MFRCPCDKDKSEVDVVSLMRGDAEVTRGEKDMVFLLRCVLGGKKFREAHCVLVGERLKNRKIKKLYILMLSL